MSKPKISTPAPPAAPSPADTARAYADAMPQMYATELQWNPKFTEQDYQMTAQYAPKYQALQASLYPELDKLDKQMTNQALEGSATSDLNPQQKQMYQDMFRAEAGDQVGSGIGSDYVSRGVLGMGMAQQQYYQNIGLTLTGRQPLYQAQQTPTTNVGQGFNYGSVSQAMQQGYGNYSNAYSSMYGANAQLGASRNQMMGNIIGGALGGIGTFAGARFGR